jgi:lipid-binding SYLF domain-containing protein
MKLRAGALAFASLLPSAAFAAGDDASTKLNDRLAAATTLLHQLQAVPDKGIPDQIARKARCVVVVPGFKKGAFLGGVQYGQGMATCFVANKGWSAPAFIQMAGVSFGLQAGGQSTDLVLVGVTKKSGDDLLKAKVKLGGDVSAAAGPVGRDSQADTTELASAEFLTYSRNKGLFAGIDLTGDEVNQNTKDTQAFYGKDIPYQTILNGATPTPVAAKPFVQEVTRVFGGVAKHKS